MQQEIQRLRPLLQKFERHFSENNRPNMWQRVNTALRSLDYEDWYEPIAVEEPERLGFLLLNYLSTNVDDRVFFIKQGLVHL